jgi:hypothetical protein
MHRIKSTLFFIAFLYATSPFFAQNVGIGTSTPQEKLDVNGSLNVEGGIRTKYSGSIVQTVVFGTTYYVNLPINPVPSGWDFTNTLVLVSNADGVVGFVEQAKLTSTTNIQLVFTAEATGPTRFNYIILKL